MISIQEEDKLVKMDFKVGEPTVKYEGAQIYSLFSASLRPWARISFKKGSANRVQGDTSYCLKAGKE